MDEPYRSQLAKVAGDACGSLAGLSVGFAIFVVTLWFTVLFYNIEVWAVVSIMVGIALACIVTRLTLFLSYCQDCKPNDVFKPVVKGLVVFGVLGVAFGWFLSPAYNEPYPNQMCYEVSIGEDPGHDEEALSGCDDYRHNIQQLLNGALIAFPIVMVVAFVVGMMYNVSRSTSSEQADSS